MCCAGSSACALIRIKSVLVPGNPLTDPNWAADVTNQIADAIGKVRDRTTNNAIRVVRAVVFGLLGFFLGFVALVLLLIGATRAFQSLLDIWFTWDRAVYLSYFVVGGLLILFGLFLMSKRARSDA